MEKLCKHWWSGCFDWNKNQILVRVIEITPHMKLIHYINHKQAFAAKNLEPELYKVWKDVISVVDFVKTTPLNRKNFILLCNEMGNDHKNLLYQERFTA